ncbi:1-(5-phosphoribosyl)-5-[(5-phosphoribosylamino) methylideneamino] imidazole-4-carboxamide isomerase [Lysobacter xinjiangensis]|uniref:1-(5-phosphoribosyl)-5-[(5-phosphoribosylamino)methylideneamino] imidazole-4-carboxamide isomerase n=1 Tax=Cognatilysobacter xinjiangensis TaxID=546892 RepID=A0ABQ3BXW8_9GAMM|nr:1-(5-phosphoribosyl)-5-[(5-phosphoribosylamino)methylideneamino]imidazole-4-carboxamide isomerase [Lysobacter xinjiangensis]GGZ61003.1 1-(5-phosphoribosyl)-5-[(5-phosphoribosylamino) methylideneamino] imidazole-4-carboxamide isomerase [Lysobacter xinjiangensis]
MSGFEVYPAIDVRDGRVVRLKQGDYAQETRYADQPLEVASRYAAAGARWLHLVDLDAARDGGYSIAALLSGIKSKTALKVQTGGGVRSKDDLLRLFDAGADRVVVGSLAVREPSTVAGWIERYGSERITVALDTREVEGEWRLPTAGWTRSDGTSLSFLLALYLGTGLRHLLCTDIGRDGMLGGPNIALYREIMQLAPRVALQASGGVRDLADIEAAREAGCAGAVLGKALLEGRFRLEDAVARADAIAC